MNRNDLRPAGAAGNARTIVRSRRTGTMVSVSHETQAARLQRCDPCDRIYCGTAGFLAAPRLAGEDTMRSHPMTDPWLSFGRFRGCARLLGLVLFVLIVALRARLSDGTTANARVVARDHENDLALLKIDVKHPLPTLPLGTANDLMIGESVFAVGNAYGYEHTVTTGIVSALKRDVTLNKEVSYKALVQID